MAIECVVFVCVIMRQMPVIKFMPHPVLCPKGREIEVESGLSICREAVKNGIFIEHACEMSCACTTCHVLVRENLDSLAPASDDEEDMLDKAWGLEPCSRLSCQALVADKDLVIEMPKYTLNIVSER